MKYLTRNKIFITLAIALFVTACSDENPESLIKSAKEYIQNKDIKSATIQLKNALQKKPDLGEARYLLGKILLENGDPTGAEVEFRKALDAKYPELVVFPDMARAMLLTNQAKKLVSELGSVRLNQPAADANLQTTLASAFSALGKPEEAAQSLAAALEASPDYGPALLFTSRQKAAAKDFDGALLVVDRAISKDPENADAWKLKGDIFQYGLNKPEDALSAYKKSTEINPKLTTSYIAAASILIQKNELSEATKQVELLKKAKPNDIDAKYLEAQISLIKKDYKTARELVSQLLRISSNNAKILQLAGAIEFQSKSLAQAEIYLSNAIKYAPELVPARRMLIATYLRTGQSFKAKATLDEIDGKNGLDPQFFSLAGDVYLHNGDAVTAEKYYSQALKVEPDNNRIRSAIAATHLATGKTEAGIDELQSISVSDKDTVADLALISAHLNLGEFDKALSAIDKLETKQPDKPIASDLRGRAMLAKKDNAAARKNFERALSIDPLYFPAIASLAAMDLADKKPAEAKRRFENLLEKNPKQAQALLALANIAAREGESKAKIESILTRAIDANPTDFAARLQLIQLLVANKELKQALVVAQSGVAALPNSPEMQNALGRVQQLSGELNQAVAAYKKLVEMQPNAPQPYIRLAEAFAASKDNKAAEENLQKALSLKPDTIEAQRGLILLSMQSKKYQNALEITRQIQKQRPKEPTGYVIEGDVWAAQKSWNEAARAYRLSLQRAATTESAIKLHSALSATGKPTDSESFATIWTKDHPKDTGFFIYLSEIAIAKKDYRTAESNLLIANNLAPDNPVILNNLAWVTGQLRKDNAIAYAEKANKISPNKPELMDTLAMLLADKGEESKAIELLNKALEIQPANPTIRLSLAKTYIRLGNKAKARAELETLAKLGQKFSAQDEVSSLLKNL